MRWFLLALALLASPSYAVTEMHVGLSWTVPTEYEDGSLILAGDIHFYTAWCGGQGDYSLSMTTPYTSAMRDELIYEMGLQADTVYYCAVSVTTANTLTSADSNEVSFVIPGDSDPPEPPPDDPPPPEPEPLIPEAPALTLQSPFAIQHYDPATFTDGSPIGVIDLRELRCSGLTVSLPAHGRLTEADVLAAVPLDTTMVCSSVVAVAGVESAPSPTITFYCHGGKGKPSERVLGCSAGERVPPGKKK